jgi:hypothetical protein
VNHLFTFGIGGLILGGILLFVGFGEKKLSDRASATPEEISLDNLIARGPAGNTNIILKDFVLCQNFVSEEKSSGGGWSKVWVPIVPTSAVPPGQLDGGRPTSVRAIIFSINISNQMELKQRCEVPKMRALLTNGLVSLGSEEKSHLSQSYSGTNFDTCLIIQEGREPAGAAKLFLMIGGGVLSLLVGLGLVGFGFVKWRADQSPRPRKKKRRREAAEEEEDERPRKRQRAVEEADEEEERPRRKSRRDEADEDDRPRKLPPRKKRRDDDDE